MLTVRLNKNEEVEKLQGFPWVFNNEVNSFDGDIINGDVCRVVTYDNRFIAYGLLNTSSKIMIRILSLNENDVIDREFYKKRIEYAIAHRNNLGFDSCCRLIFAEADYLPGLIVDKYGDYLSIQFLCLGMDKIKDMILSEAFETLASISIVFPSGNSTKAESPCPTSRKCIFIFSFCTGSSVGDSVGVSETIAVDGALSLLPPSAPVGSALPNIFLQPVKQFRHKTRANNTNKIFFKYAKLCFIIFSFFFIDYTIYHLS
jgi:hypothetical protein